MKSFLDIFLADCKGQAAVRLAEHMFKPANKKGCAQPTNTAKNDFLIEKNVSVTPGHISAICFFQDHEDPDV